ncbi:MAG TPA: hypothetical protein VJV23_02735 [Candidatus Polarisedimenticolia bacterium]|nr:hypothetical protein [Candidatus Polarisedimenticolia bacterium]
MTRGERLDSEHGHDGSHPWYMVLWLTGVDYFSTLGYQPGIALLAAGALSPLATLVLVAVTLLGALPVYSQVARRSYAGQGSIAMLETLLSGWTSKILVLGLLSFAATDFVITMTLSAADAAQHAVENPLLHPWLGDARLAITCLLLGLLAAVFLRGFMEAIGTAAVVAVPYLLLNLLVLGRGLIEIARQPELLSGWKEALWARGDPAALALAVAIVFPKLALGMSGFETGVSVMPLIQGGHGAGGRVPEERIAAARKLLASAALIMSVMLLLSSFVTVLLVEPEAYAKGGPASGRAIAYLAHRYFGSALGTVYDLSTIAILWFAGASAMAGLLHLVPRYLPRFGMAPEWIAYRRPLVIVLFAVCVAVTVAFDADVEAQGGAYATGVLVLMLSAAFAVALALRREGSRLSFYFWLVTAVFAFTLADNVVERPDGVIIATLFIAGIVTVSAVSRWRRATELRVTRVTFADQASADLWPRIRGKQVNLVPLRTWTPEAIERKAAELHRHYALKGPIAFVHVKLLDNRSEFLSPLRLRVLQQGDHFAIEVAGAVAIANTVAYVSELVDPISLFLGLTRRNLMTQAFRYVLWGEGETGLMVYAILLRYWEWTPEEDVRPLIFLMSE